MTTARVEAGHPHRPKILFVGEIHSTHALSWIDLLRGEPFDVRAFSLAPYRPPATFPYPTDAPLLASRGRRLFDLSMKALAPRYFLAHNDEAFLQKRLAALIRSWRPDIVHCFGASTAGLFLSRTVDRFGLAKDFKLSIQARGGPDLEDSIHDASVLKDLTAALQACDLFFADNDKGYRIARSLGCSSEAIGDASRFPGTGGMAFDDRPRVPPSQRERIILVPKAYEGYQSKVLPVFEALKTAWQHIKPAKIILAAVNDEPLKYLKRMDHEIGSHINIHPRIPREQILSFMAQARLMLAPSIMDGVPNSLYEAMANGALPIVSPLETISTVVAEPDNVFFAGNFDVEKLVSSTITLMSDDALGDAMAQRNLSLVRDIADRDKMKVKLLARYGSLANSDGSQLSNWGESVRVSQ